MRPLLLEVDKRYSSQLCYLEVSRQVCCYTVTLTTVLYVVSPPCNFSGSSRRGARMKFRVRHFTFDTDAFRFWKKRNLLTINHNLPHTEVVSE